MHMGNA